MLKIFVLNVPLGPISYIIFLQLLNPNPIPYEFKPF